MASRDRIGLLETSTHENFLITMAEVATGAGYDVTIFTSETVFKRISSRLGTDKYCYIIKKDSESIGSFLKTVIQQSGDLRFLFGFPFNGTVLDFFHYTRFTPSCPFVLSVYNANTWIPRNIRLTPKVYNYGRIPLRLRILANVDAIAVEYDPIKSYLETYLDIPIYSIAPVCSRDQQESTGDRGRFTVTIPGIIDSKRRDYNMLFNVLEQLPNRTKSAVSFQLLGRAVEGSEWITSKAEAYRSGGWNIEYYTDWIPSSEFETVLSDTDIILSPLRRMKSHGVAVEEYGKTKSSGALGDAIRVSKPLVLPSWFDVPDQLEPGTIGFENSDELATILEGFVVNRQELERLKKDAIGAANNYSLDEQAARFHEMVNSTVSRR